MFSKYSSQYRHVQGEKPKLLPWRFYRKPPATIRRAGLYSQNHDTQAILWWHHYCGQPIALSAFFRGVPDGTRFVSHGSRLARWTHARRNSCAPAEWLEPEIDKLHHLAIEKLMNCACSEAVPRKLINSIKHFTNSKLINMFVNWWRLLNFWYFGIRFTQSFLI